ETLSANLWTNLSSWMPRREASPQVLRSPAGVDGSSFTLSVVDSVLHDWLVPVLPEDTYVKDMELFVHFLELQ
ncbi:hypothetical protein Tco_0353709, partial [Tanacetum coccineum]